MTSGADWNREELLQARRDGAELVPNSGRGNKKGDARMVMPTRTLLIDYKFTDKNSYTINLTKYNDFFKQAYRESATPVIVSVFRQGDRELAIIDWATLKDLVLWEAETDD